ncbi:BAR adaptor protein Hob1 [Knufia obscura]|uniref:BAR adaptor protein Hob1 n=2 Tax=Knufia TaxID=430999 RepID=A0AAN8ELQ0_9EURO|nr:BAR adaptor protein Hob1 [Knufia obscura]KAK5958694.1 BAR adaptor protein Hob1 [Knufia fluminis]
MSIKGFTKSITRTPQQFKQRFNLGDITKDAIFIDAERRFEELETETKKLHDESKKYFEAINGMLDHQIEFSQAVAEIYKPISGRMSDPNSLMPEGNPAGIEACEQYESIVRELKATLQPELEMIEQRVIVPADQLLEVVKVIRKVVIKRQHKQLDYDRHRAVLKKLQDKKEKTLKDEKALFKAESDVEQATQDFEYFNNLLKDELPKLFALEAEFIRPLFQSFYYMQLNVFYTLHEKMQGINIGYFDLTLDIEAAFEKKRGDIKEQTEALSIVHFKSTGGPKRTGTLQSKYGSGKSKYEEASKPRYGQRHDPEAGEANPPPPYSPGLGSANGSTPASPSLNATIAAKGKPPPPKPKPSRLSGVPAAETVTALYDYEAQAEGDLSFTTGEVIDIVSRTQNENEWWTGRIGARQGQFPGNYVRLN